MIKAPTSFEVLYFIHYPPPYPQPTKSFFDPKTGVFFPYAWPNHKIGVDLYHEFSAPDFKKSYPEKVLGIPVIFPAIPYGFEIAPHLHGWKLFRFTWTSFFRQPERLLKELHDQVTRTDPEPPIAVDDRELDILRYIAGGLPYRAIAFELGTSTKTVSTIVTRLKEKLFADSLSSLIGRALILGILEDEDFYLDGFPR